MKFAHIIFTTALLFTAAHAHFQVLVPDAPVVSDEAKNTIALTSKFTHPFEQMMMQMERPKTLAVFDGTKTTKLEPKKQTQGKFDFYTATYAITKPGVFQFYIDPTPYFEPVEEKFIRHIAKTYVSAFGYGDGWQKPVGLKAEILPLTRPFGLYAGNIFTARVLYKGSPAKNTPVEVEFYNEKGLKAPTEEHITQVVMTNEAGEFSFVMPLEGWWGFAALIDDDERVKKEGKSYPVELGALLWVKTESYKK